jgi:hypothetical protein
MWEEYLSAPLAPRGTVYIFFLTNRSCRPEKVAKYISAKKNWMKGIFLFYFKNELFIKSVPDLST